jgi:hypothetical protein
VVVVEEVDELETLVVDDVLELVVVLETLVVDVVLEVVELVVVVTVAVVVVGASRVRPNQRYSGRAFAFRLPPCSE